jgi:proteasome lid subunit RPN8/RPN11
MLTGARRGRLWLGRLRAREVGEPCRVRFDGDRVLRREERCHDVVGFFHTHPGMPAVPSVRDRRTMRAWCSCFGKALLCVIAGCDGVRGYRFDDDTSLGIELELVERFPDGVIVGVDSDG